MPRRRKVSKKLVLQRVAYWREVLHLHDWELSVVVEPLPEEDDATAACSAQPAYKAATLHFDPYDITKAALDNYVVHELLHCLVEPLADLATVAAGEDPMRRAAVTREEESLVTALERVLVTLAASAPASASPAPPHPPAAH